jgi:Ceramidase
MHSGYVAETHNTITSGIIALIGAAGAAAARRVQAEGRHVLLGVLLCIIGLGSIAFHGALRKWMQVRAPASAATA